ncbi:MAG: hypothetical protein F6K39_11310 [Okeania sp. SIO3B3]|nr:hypothetical protein [Okeania sp. SIO3B3]
MKSEDKSIPELKTDKIQPNWENSIGLDAVLDKDIYSRRRDAVDLSQPEGGGTAGWQSLGALRQKVLGLAYADLR